ncbi:MAG TPA: hypothetical protein VFD32_00920 [Dehalococcoidia bacterium]|nr:hypothetical protein [Dehalococcoidia bacterium]
MAAGTRSAISLLLAVACLQAACQGGRSVYRQVAGGTAPGATATERFSRVETPVLTCPVAQPIKVSVNGQIVAPADAVYPTTRPTLCYGREADAVADGFRREPTGANGVAASATVQATPLPLAAIAAAVFARLGATPITDAELPGGMSMPRQAPGTAVQDANAPVAALIGELDVGLSGPDERNLIAYLVFPSETAAATAFATQGAGHDARDPVVFTPSGMSYLSRCASGSVAGEVGAALGTTICYVQIGYVEVVGLSARRDASGRSPQGDPDTAIALARAGVQHFLRAQR